MSEFIPARVWRNTFPAQDHPTDLQRPGNICKIPAGNVGRKGIDVMEDGSIVIGPKVYFDDVLAFLLGCQKSNPGLKSEIKNLMAETIDAADRRNFEKGGHCYNHSPEEANHNWKNLEGFF